MIVPHLRCTHAVVSCIVKTTSCNTTPQAEGATLKRRVINANCVECAHQHRERPQKHAQQCIWKQRALTSGRTNLGGKHKKKTSQNISWTVFAAHFYLSRSCNMHDRAARHYNYTMLLSLPSELGKCTICKRHMEHQRNSENKLHLHVCATQIKFNGRATSVTKKFLPWQLTHAIRPPGEKKMHCTFRACRRCQAPYTQLAGCITLFCLERFP